MVATEQTRKKIAIIGGGITGLSTAFFLQEKLKGAAAPIDLVLIESENRLGGKILTQQVDEFIIEGGPDSFITQKPWALELCKKLGLNDQLISTHPVHKAIYVLSNGRLRPLPVGFNLMVPGRMAPFLFSPLVSLVGKARMGLDLVIRKKEDAGDESIASFVRRRLGEEALEKFAEPILAGIYAGDAERLSLAATFPQFAELERTDRSLIVGMRKRRRALSTAKKPSADWSLFVSLKGGLSSLTRAIEATLVGTSILRGRKVITVAPREGRYEITLEGERLFADAVIVTTSATVAAGWTDPWDLALSKSLREISYLSTATVSLGFRREDVTHPLEGFGFVVPRREGKRIMAATWSSTKFPGRAPEGHLLVRGFLGGAHQEALAQQDDDSLIAIVREELRPILGIRGKPVVAKSFRWTKANPQYNIGHLHRIAEIERLTAGHPGLFLAGAAYRGVGIPDCIHQGMETAEKVFDFLAKN